MSRTFFAAALDTAASWWRIYRRDGVTLGFTTHDRDLWFDGVLHRAAPGMLPSAIRHTRGFEDDPADIEGALSHDAVRADDLAAGRYDGARIESGLVDWVTKASATLYAGTIATLRREGAGFRAELASVKAPLARDPVPLSSPTCRAQFCGPECGLSAAACSARARITALDPDAGSLTVDRADTATYRYGELRWLDGPTTGLAAHILDASGATLTLAGGLAPGVAAGMRVLLREGCDRTIATCSSRFGNAVNFRGEPFLPGNDMLAHYPAPR